MAQSAQQIGGDDHQGSNDRCQLAFVRRHAERYDDVLGSR
jgi:hypothetical protein